MGGKQESRKSVHMESVLADRAKTCVFLFCLSYINNYLFAQRHSAKPKDAVQGKVWLTWKAVTTF